MDISLFKGQSKKLLPLLLATVFLTACNEHQPAEKNGEVSPTVSGENTSSASTAVGITATDWLAVKQKEYGDSGVVIALQASTTDNAGASAQWRQISGPNATLINAGQLNAQVLLPFVSVPTELTFEINASRDGKTVVAKQAVVALPLVPRAEVVNLVLTGENNTVAIDLAEPVAANTAVSLVVSAGSADEGVDFATLSTTVTTVDGTRIEIPIQVLPSNRSEDVYTKIAMRAGDGGDPIVVTVVIPANVAEAVAAAASSSALAASSTVAVSSATSASAAPESSSSDAGLNPPSSEVFSNSSFGDSSPSSSISPPSSFAVSSVASSAGSIAEDNDPTPFVFTSQNDVALNTLVISNTISVSDINSATAISITGGEYSIDGGAFTSAVGAVTNGQSVQVQQLSSNALNATTTVTLTIGGVSADFNVITYAVAPRPFITTWKTDNRGKSNDDQITITTRGTGYDYFVDWGDGSTDNNVAGDITHTYASPGTYTVSISGDFPQLFFRTFGDNSKLLSVEQWGTNAWRSMYRFFNECINLESNATDVPNLSRVTNMSGLFYNALAFNQDLSRWDVSAVRNMESMFHGASAFNQDLSGWDVSAVTDMRDMFSDASAFNQDLIGWDVSAVTSMASMFNGASAFNQDLSGWGVSDVTDMRGMFSNAIAFDQDLGSWDVSAVTDMGSMFSGASAFNQDLSGWDVSAVTNMVSMFDGASAFNQDLSRWDVSAVTNMVSMFDGASAFNQDLSSWDVSAVTAMYEMFQRTSAFNQDLSGWDVSAVTDMRGMFSNAIAFDQDLSGWDVSAVKFMYYMFADASVFDQDLSRWDVSAVKNMESMFHGASAFNQDLSGWDVSAVTDMRDMFSDASAFNQDLSGWNVSAVTDMRGMFSNAIGFDQDLGSWDVSAVTDMGSMFSGASAFNQDLSGWDVSAITNMGGMFSGATLSTPNYDALLIGWGARGLQNSVSFHGGNSQYSSAAQAAREVLTTGFGWRITDGGLAE